MEKDIAQSHRYINMKKFIKMSLMETLKIPNLAGLVMQEALQRLA
jgi:hypothetical protein